MKEISDDLKVSYFEIILEFGLTSNSGFSPSESPGMPYRIPLLIKNKQGVECRATAYGKDIIEVCEHAFEWLSHYRRKVGYRMTVEGTFPKYEYLDYNPT